MSVPCVLLNEVNEILNQLRPDQPSCMFFHIPIQHNVWILVGGWVRKKGLFELESEKHPYTLKSMFGYKSYTKHEKELFPFSNYSRPYRLSLVYIHLLWWSRKILSLFRPTPTLYCVLGGNAKKWHKMTPIMLCVLCVSSYNYL